LHVSDHVSGFFSRHCLFDLSLLSHLSGCKLFDRYFAVFVWKPSVFILLLYWGWTIGTCLSVLQVIPGTIRQFGNPLRCGAERNWNMLQHHLPELVELTQKNTAI